MNSPINNLELREALQEKFGKLPYQQFDAAISAAQFVLEWQAARNVVLPEKQFAKIFAVDENQVLVVLTTDDDGNPAIKVLTRVEDENLATVGVSFQMDDNDKAWEKATMAFNMINQQSAEGFRREELVKLGLLPQVKDGL